MTTRDEDRLSLAQHWLDRYECGHSERSNRRLHLVCAPLFMASLVGLAWGIPVPAPLRDLTLLVNWGVFFIMACLVYYFILSTRLALGLLPFIVLVVAGFTWIDAADGPIVLVSASGMLLAGAGQLLGHRFDAASGSLLRDLHYSIIGPAWVLAHLYRRLGIRY